MGRGARLRRRPGPPTPPALLPSPALTLFLSVPGHATSPTARPSLHLRPILLFLFLLVLAGGDLRGRRAWRARRPQPDGAEKQPPASEEDGIRRRAGRSRGQRRRAEPKHLSHFAHLQRLPPLLLLDGRRKSADRGGSLKVGVT